MERRAGERRAEERKQGEGGAHSLRDATFRASESLIRDSLRKGGQRVQCRGRGPGASFPVGRSEHSSCAVRCSRSVPHFPLVENA